MGNADARQLPFDKTDLRPLLERQQTGSIINLSAASKQAFIKQQTNRTFNSLQITQLQPESVSKWLGFLYKPSVFFYQGGISNENMEGRGRLTLLRKGITYEGMFKENQFHGNGVLRHEQPQLILTGMWEYGKPKNIRFDRNAKEYSILVHEAQGQGVFRGLIRYWDGTSYEGEFTYDEANKRFHVTGAGKFFYKNNDYISGQFVEGNLNGQGEFLSVSGRYKGEFQNGRFNGPGEFVYKDGKVLSIGWKENKPHGQGWLKINSFSAPVVYEHGKRLLTLEKSAIKW